VQGWNSSELWTVVVIALGNAVSKARSIGMDRATSVTDDHKRKSNI
jgi:hypothetical protein